MGEYGFIQGAISSEFIVQSIDKYQSKHTIGAYNIFLGQIRADIHQENVVIAIEYTVYQEMADKTMNKIIEKAFLTYDLNSIHIYHSLGTVKVGEICLFVLVSAIHRRQVYEATETIINWIKTEVPIFGRELFGNDTFTWKKNT